MELFIHWRQETMSLPDNNKRNTMTLATVTPDGHPSARAVLLCGMDNLGYNISSKEQEIEHNSMGALDFMWPFLRSDGVPVVRESGGRLKKVSTEESQTYFDSEPVTGDMQQVVNNQTQKILIKDKGAYDQRNQDSNHKITKPPQWGGYRLRPSMMEFYERAGDNFADRVRFKKQTVAEESGNNESGMFPGENGWVYFEVEP